MFNCLAHASFSGMTFTEFTEFNESLQSIELAWLPGNLCPFSTSSYILR